MCDPIVSDSGCFCDRDGKRCDRARCGALRVAVLYAKWVEAAHADYLAWEEYEAGRNAHGAAAQAKDARLYGRREASLRVVAAAASATAPAGRDSAIAATLGAAVAGSDRVSGRSSRSRRGRGRGRGGVGAAQSFWRLEGLHCEFLAQ